MDETTPTLCVALDSSDRAWILEIAHRLAPSVDWLKVGLESYTAFGPRLIQDLSVLGCRVFLDLKLHDIPNTVERAAANCAHTGADMVNVHASGGRRMLEAAVSGVRSVPQGTRTRIIAVTVLTSLDNSSLAAIGFSQNAEGLVLDWARMAQDCGLDGVVASAREAAKIRAACGQEFIIVTPGIRPNNAASADQKRIVTPRDAVASGANILVVGRPITESGDPVKAAQEIRAEMISS
ncbi:MAG: orotidine-5'-phosphate decarboxylase [bacterium]|nr:orotidine-5'-phosphate decarboxylase [bacterium]